MSLSPHQQAPSGPTAVLLLGMGGPAEATEIGPYLQRLFADPHLIELPFQPLLGPLIARTRRDRLRQRYAEIGGASPIARLTARQAQALSARLAALRPEADLHVEIAFRYAQPDVHTALRALKARNVARVLVFLQYPHWACATSASALAQLGAALRAEPWSQPCEWGVIDRWGCDPGYISFLVQALRDHLSQSPPTPAPLLLFTAHALPMRQVARGQNYAQEVAATVHEVMKALGFAFPYLLSYQSAIGPVAWLQPSTVDVIDGLGRHGQQRVVVVPVGFTTDHLETLYDLDIVLAQRAQRAGLTHFHRLPAPNDAPAFIDAMAAMVLAHLDGSALPSMNLTLRCPGCQHERCPADDFGFLS